MLSKMPHMNRQNKGIFNDLSSNTSLKIPLKHLYFAYICVAFLTTLKMFIKMFF